MGIGIVVAWPPQDVVVGASEVDHLEAEVFPVVVGVVAKGDRQCHLSELLCLLSKNNSMEGRSRGFKGRSWDPQPTRVFDRGC